MEPPHKITPVAILNVLQRVLDENGGIRTLALMEQLVPKFLKYPKPMQCIILMLTLQKTRPAIIREFIKSSPCSQLFVEWYGQMLAELTLIGEKALDLPGPEEEPIEPKLPVNRVKRSILKLPDTPNTKQKKKLQFNKNLIKVQEFTWIPSERARNVGQTLVRKLNISSADLSTDEIEELLDNLMSFEHLRKVVKSPSLGKRDIPQVIPSIEDDKQQCPPSSMAEFLFSPPSAPAIELEEEDIEAEDIEGQISEDEFSEDEGIDEEMVENEAIDEQEQEDQAFLDMLTQQPGIEGLPRVGQDDDEDHGEPQFFIK